MSPRNSLKMKEKLDERRGGTLKSQKRFLLGLSKKTYKNFINLIFSLKTRN